MILFYSLKDKTIFQNKLMKKATNIIKTLNIPILSTWVTSSKVITLNIFKMYTHIYIYKLHKTNNIKGR